ncbi:MAG: 50S ribosomal protein L3 [Cellvibrionales bacterium TMED49]|nr:50S ribosomal protein L3 [Porticoccaceae bacterium]OUU39247.1 MAG: 50S ribosomal protein L3 [Cellvibrionales bacterium TMED49]
MTLGLVGRKCGMTRVFSDDGLAIPVTVIEVQPNKITQIKTLACDGYEAIQVTKGHQKTSRLNRSQVGHMMKAGIESGNGYWEFRTDGLSESFKLGATLTVDRFVDGQYIDVVATSKGKGFQGGVKRWNFAMQDATHGNSISHRAPGSIGQNQTPGRVFKGKKMAGQMGGQRVTTQNLQIVRVDSDRQLILVKGAVAGAPGGDVLIRPAVKG